METAYKYCGEHGLTILRNLELLVRPPNQFNDPFEFTPKMSYSDPVGYAEKHLANESILQWLYDSQCSLGKFSGSFDKFKELTIKHKSKVLEVFVGVLPLGTAQAEKEFLDEVSKRFGILEEEVREIFAQPCFSRVKLDRAVLNTNDFTVEFEPVELKP
jgi:hypothetical protein